MWRRDAWIPTKDLGRVDEDGYFYHAGRADDVIISAGWTMSAVEIEDAILKHPQVQEAAAIGVPDALRGQVVKAFVVASREGDDTFVEEIQQLVRTRLAAHEYPRHDRIRRRAAKDSRRQGPPQSAARARACCTGGFGRRRPVLTQPIGNDRWKC